MRVIAGRYEIRESLGSGGMANVHRAHDRVLDRDIALKSEIDQTTAASKRSMQMAEEAARAVAQVGVQFGEVTNKFSSQKTYLALGKLGLTFSIINYEIYKNFKPVLRITKIIF